MPWQVHVNKGTWQRLQVICSADEKTLLTEDGSAADCLVHSCHYTAEYPVDYREELCDRRATPPRNIGRIHCQAHGLCPVLEIKPAMHHFYRANAHGVASHTTALGIAVRERKKRKKRRKKSKRKECNGSHHSWHQQACKAWAPACGYKTLK